ncbi:ATP-binding protein [Xanthomonas sacchari]
MAKGSRGNAANEALFEEDYVLRTLGKIGYDGETALTELVANAWDAGASRVSIIIPEASGSSLTVEDDGHGMSADNFRARWMKLGYNRIKNQGNGVEFPPERAGQHRIPFGRNGVGRHGLLCFASQYEVETWRGGDATTFVINTQNNPSPFYIERETKSKKPGHGTRLSVVVDRHLPNPLSVRKVLAGRFVHDPQFTVEVNGHSVPLAQHEGPQHRSAPHRVWINRRGSHRGHHAGCPEYSLPGHCVLGEPPSSWHPALGRRNHAGSGWALAVCQTVCRGH